MWRFLKYSYTLPLCLLVFCCKQVQEEEYSRLTEQDINEVIHAIVVQDSLFYGKSSDIPLSTDLFRLDLYFPDATLNGQDPPPVPWKSNFYELIGLHGKTSPFTVQDSSYLLFQYEKLQGFVLDRGIYRNIHFTTWEEQEPKLRAQEHTAFYELSIPLFSADKTKVYVEMNYRCYKLCGYGKEYVLEKTNGKWIVVKKSVKWFS
ncbi:hypothetical protein [Pontibacter flavimaris]|uniref:Uncharacterized protein n=1 Tax=Pontibacter flavimaris TaxID=1797110 RepID=A0A1Q5PBY2_9BACT|nr:hypothetical protein [Pontibacter flavimaris]OKL39745.1 hypothetical protein A3841_00515 [Pontibacter flavimaris]